MRSSWILVLAIVLGVIVTFLPKEYALMILNFFMTREGIGVITSIIAGSFALWVQKSKSGQDLFKSEVNTNMKELTIKIAELNDSVQLLKHDFDEMKLGKATRDNYEQQLNKVISTSINYFNIDKDLQTLIRIMAEDFKKYCSSVQDHDLKNLTYNDIKQSCIAYSDEIKMKAIELMGEDYGNMYHEYFLEDFKDFMKKVRYILDDKVNNKNYRFFTASIDYLQTSMSKSLQFFVDWNNLA